MNKRKCLSIAAGGMLAAMMMWQMPVGQAADKESQTYREEHTVDVVEQTADD